jgi:hypothetical protein
MGHPLSIIVRLRSSIFLRQNIFSFSQVGSPRTSHLTPVEVYRLPLLLTRDLHDVHSGQITLEVEEEEEEEERVCASVCIFLHVKRRSQYSECD